MTEQARDKNGEFASGGHAGEQGARQAGRYAVKLHVDRSVGTQTGKSALVGLLKNAGKAALGIGLGAAGAIGKSALRNQGGRRH